MGADDAKGKGTKRTVLAASLTSPQNDVHMELVLAREVALTEHFKPIRIPITKFDGKLEFVTPKKAIRPRRRIIIELIEKLARSVCYSDAYRTCQETENSDFAHENSMK